MPKPEDHKRQRDDALQERDKARGELAQEIQKAETLADDTITQDNFIATVSHDLRNPVGAIKMALELLKRGHTSPDRQNLLNLIERNADQAEELINHLLDAHLIRAGTPLPISASRCDLLPILRGCRETLTPDLQSKVKLEFSESEQVWGVWDGQALERAFKNLINNAIKFGDTDKEILIRVRQQSDTTSVCFQNFGEPISEKNLLRIFDTHFRTQSTEVKKGWGLGLTIVRGIAEAHNGKVEVQSNSSEGTVFTLKLPNQATDT